MSNQAVVSGDGDYPAVYVSGGNLNGPSGIEMTEGEDNLWTLTTTLNLETILINLGMDIITIGMDLVGRRMMV